MEKKVNEILLTRKINNYIESKLIEFEENLARFEERIAESIKENDIGLAYCYYQNMISVNKSKEIIKSFKDYLLKDQKE